MGAVGGATGWQGEIRHADIGDIGGVAALAAELAMSFEFSPGQFRVSYPALLAAGGVCLLLAADGSESAGYLLGFRHLTFHANGPVAWVEEVVVRSRDRGQGLSCELPQAIVLRLAGQRRCSVACRGTTALPPFLVIPLRCGGRRAMTWHVDHVTDSPVPDEGSRAELRGGFDDDAVAYDRTRPACPGVMFDDLMRAARLKRGDRVVETGCRTRQATVPLAERGLAVTAVELGPALAALARPRTGGYIGVSVAAAAFEDWQDDGETPVRAVVAFNPLHWIDPAVRYAKPAALLPAGAFTGALLVTSRNRSSRIARPELWSLVSEGTLGGRRRGRSR